MKKRKVIKSNNLPQRLPIWSTIISAIALDYWHAPQWLWGAIGLFFLMGWIASIASIIKQEEVDLLKNGE